MVSLQATLLLNYNPFCPDLSLRPDAVMPAKIIATANEMETYAAQLALQLSPPKIIFLHGDLGAGKTTFVRGFLRALGHTGTVKSPTYTLIETYSFPSMRCHHLDLYRLADPYELENLGVRDLFDNQSIFLIEWPEMAAGHLPEVDIDLTITYHEGGRLVLINE